MRKMISLSLLCCILLAFLVQTGSCITATINMVKNGGFESGLDNWEKLIDGDGEVVVVENPSEAPEGSCYLCVGRSQDYPASHAVRLCGDTIFNSFNSSWTKTTIDITQYRGQTCYLEFKSSFGPPYYSATARQSIFIPYDAQYLTFYQKLGNHRYFIDDVRILVTRDYEEIQDPSFEWGVVFNNPDICWAPYEEVNATSYSTTAASVADYAKHGTNSLKLSASISDGNYVLAGVRQKIELTNANYLKFWLYMPSDAVNEAYIGVAIDNVTVWARSAKTMTWEEFAVNVRGYTGVHDVMFFAYAKNTSSSSVEGYIDFVHFGEVNPVTIEGYVYDALTGLPVEGCNITATQSGGSYEATSGSDGYYNITGLVTNYEVEISASKAGYRLSLIHI